MAPRIICVSTCDADGSRVFKENAEEALKELLQRACLDEFLLVGHVVCYDCACILASYPDLWDLVWVAYQGNAITCTAIRERLLDIAVGEFRFHVEEDQDKKHDYDLASLAKRRFGNELNKDEDSWRKRFVELENVPLNNWPTEAIIYCKADAKSTYELFQDQELRARNLGYDLPTQYDDVRADFALKLMSVHGIMTDREKVETLRAFSQARLLSLGKELQTSGLVEYRENKNMDLFGASETLPEITKKNKAIQAAVQKHHPNPPCTEKGNIKIDAETLMDCHYKPFDALIEYTGIEKTLSTYLSKIIESPIHAHFKAIGAASARTSCSNPNLQNQPRLPGVRECFVPRPGFVFLAVDFATQEMRTLAQSCLDILGQSRLAERYGQDPDFDPHAEFAVQLVVGIKDPDMGAFRQRAKVANFGYPGGMGPEKFVQYAKAYNVFLTLDESRSLRDKWFQQWPEMKKYFNFVSNLIRDGAGVSRIPQSGFLRAGVGFTDACNSYFQTLAAHASKLALWEVTKRCYNFSNSWLYGSRPVLFVHDEIVLEVPEEVGHEAAMETISIMEKAQARWTPKVPAKAEATLMRYWSKSAEAVWKEGRLIPWE
jgi:DNA polymerase I-like protein with 3'-5' exonuclease and polymerase domains